MLSVLNLRRSVLSRGMVVGALATLAARGADAQTLLVTDATNRRVMLFDTHDGSLLDPAFIDLQAPGGATGITPIEALRTPNGDIVISDQVRDTVFRYTGDGQTFLGESSVPMNNVHGLAVAYGSIWVTNSNPNGTTPGRALLQLDQSLNLVAIHLLPALPFDVMAFTWQGVEGLLITDFGGSSVLFFDPASPTAVQTFYAPQPGTSGLNTPMYLSQRRFDGNVLVGGLISPAGIYELDRTSGAQVAYISNPGGQTSVHCAHDLFDGRILFTNMTGVHRFDPATGVTTTLVAGVNAHVIADYNDGRIGASYCAATRNSTGVSAFLYASGSLLASQNDCTLQGLSLPHNAAAFFLASRTQDFVAFPAGSAGNLCLGGAIGRYVGPGQIKNSGAAGAVSLTLDLAVVPSPTGAVSVTPGETWSFQCWYRDSVNGAATSNFTSGRAIPFQ
ncbi:MAG: hypothetical protein R3F49_21290 [Planctomycetota bacterium]